MINYLGLFMGSKHEQIGRTRENVDGGEGGKGKKEISGCNTRLPLQNGNQSRQSSWKLHATDFGRIIRELRPSHKSSLSVRIQRRYSDIQIKDEHKAALLKLQMITGQKITGANTIMRDGWLECSISGFLGYNSIVIVKNICSKTSFNEAAKKDPDFCLKLLRDEILALSPDHDYWCEVQGCLQICDKEKCYFVVTNSDPGHQEFHYQIVSRDPGLWDNVLLPKLESYAK